MPKLAAAILSALLFLAGPVQAAGESGGKDEPAPAAEGAKASAPAAAKKKKAKAETAGAAKPGVTEGVTKEGKAPEAEKPCEPVKPCPIDG